MIVLTDTSALELLRHQSEGLGLRSFRDEDTRPHRFPTVRSIKPTAYAPSHEDALLLIDQHPYLSLPLHVLAPSAGSRPHSRLLQSHCWSGKWDPGAIIRADGLFALRPELCFIRMTKHLSRIKAIELGFELCGCYAKRIDGQGFTQRPPLMTPEDIKRVSEGSSLKGGTRSAGICMGRIVPRSGSPMETALAMLLFLPKDYGGYGFPRASLNFPLTARTRSDRARSFCCDVMWPQQNLALEYDSTQWHSGATDIGRDSSKRAALLARGIDVVSVTWSQIVDEEKLDVIAAIIASKLGWRLRGLDHRWREKQRALKHVLLFEDAS